MGSSRATKERSATTAMPATDAGANADVRIFLQLGYVVIGLSNLDAQAAGRLVDFFVNRVP